MASFVELGGGGGPPRSRRGGELPLFMDVHENLPEGAGAKDVAGAHRADVQTQEKYGVTHKKY